MPTGVCSSQIVVLLTLLFVPRVHDAGLLQKDVQAVAKQRTVSMSPYSVVYSTAVIRHCCWQSSHILVH